MEDPGTCTSKETAISWNNLDPTDFLPSNGKAADADKLDGQDSSALLPSAIYEVVLQSIDGFDFDPSGGKQANAACDGGETLLSGGFSGMDQGTYLIASFPEKSANPWVVRWKNDATVDFGGVHALCADFPPAHT